MNTLLVPTDFSKHAENGMRLAGLIASRTRSDIVVHHNVTTLGNWHELSDQERVAYPEILAETTKTERLLNELVRNGIHGDPALTAAITHGITPEAIVSKARESKASMIVMGSHGEGGFNPPFIGSNVQKVIRHAECPVLLAKDYLPENGLRKIVCAFPLVEDIRKPFEEIAKLATAFGAVIHLLFVNTPAKFKGSRAIKAQMDQFSAAHPGQSFVLATHCSEDVATGIIEYCEDIQADLIAMTTHDRLHKADYLIGVTESVAFVADIPVLSVNIRSYRPVLK